jgi:hypothetical protein
MKKILIFTLLIAILSPKQAYLADVDSLVGAICAGTCLVGTGLMWTGAMAVGIISYKYSKIKIKKLKSQIRTIENLSRELVRLSNKEDLTPEDNLAKQEIEVKISNILNEDIITNFNIEELKKIIKNKLKSYNRWKIGGGIIGFGSLIPIIIATCGYGSCLGCFICQMTSSENS